MRVTTWWSLLVACVLSLTAAPGARAQSSPEGPSTAVLAITPANHYHGTSRLWRAPADTVSARIDPQRGLIVDLRTGEEGGTAYIEAAPPAGRGLEVGEYADASDPEWRPLHHPGLRVRADGLRCESTEATFEIRDLAVAPGGAVERLWLVLEQDCGLPETGITGEVRIGMPASAPGVTVAPTVARWVEAFRGAPPLTRAVTLVNHGLVPLAVGTSQVLGAHAADWAIADDGCAGGTVAPGGTCTVRVGFGPRRGGPRLARLEIVDVAGRRHVTALEGRGSPGRTQLVFDSQPGEILLDGSDRRFTPADAAMHFSGGRQNFGVVAEPFDTGARNGIHLRPAEPDVLAPGTFDRVEKSLSWHGLTPYFELSADGTGCGDVDGSFTVRSARFSRLGGLRSLAAGFSVRCEGVGRPLRGTVEYRLPTGDQLPPAPVTDLVASAGPTGDRVKVRWANPADADWFTTVVRYAPGHEPPASPLSGRLVATTRGDSATVGADGPVAISVFAMDGSGNVSRRTTARIGEAPPPPAAVPARAATLAIWGGNSLHPPATRVYDQEDARITLTGDARDLTVEVAQAVADQAVAGPRVLRLAAPDGARLRPGRYADATGFGVRVASRPAMDLGYVERPDCEASHVGAFDVKHLRAGASGRVEELWVTFEYSCGPARFARVGELRYGMRAPDPDLQVAPAIANWPETHPRTDGLARAVRLRNTSPGDLRVLGVATGGLNAGDFSVRGDECTGATLAPDDVCVVHVRFSPLAAGPRYGRLDLLTASGRAAVPLEGTGAAGLTRVRVDAEAGAWHDWPVSVEYSPSGAAILAQETGSGVATYVLKPHGEQMRIGLSAPAGTALRTGHYPGATSYAADGPGLRMNLGSGESCYEEDGEFTVTSVRYGAHGRLLGFGAGAVRECRPQPWEDQDPPEVRVRIDYKVRSGDVQPPARVTGLAARREAGVLRVTWTNPPDGDWAATVIRRLPGTVPPSRSPLSGRHVTATRGGSVALVEPGATAFAAYAVDRAGNVSAPATIVVPAR